MCLGLLFSFMWSRGFCPSIKRQISESLTSTTQISGFLSTLKSSCFKTWYLASKPLNILEITLSIRFLNEYLNYSLADVIISASFLAVGRPLASILQCILVHEFILIILRWLVRTKYKLNNLNEFIIVCLGPTLVRTYNLLDL